MKTVAVIGDRALDAVRAEAGEGHGVRVAVAGDGAELGLHRRRQLVLVTLAVGEALDDEGRRRR